MYPRMQFVSTAPSQARSEDSYHYGRFEQAIAFPNIGDTGFGAAFRLKEWHYIAVCAPNHFFACAIVRLGYATKFFAYLVDLTGPPKTVDLSVLRPLSWGVSFAKSSVEGQTRWKGRKGSLCLTYVKTPVPGWEVDVDLVLEAVKLQGKFHIADATALALLFQLPTGKPAYTHKAAGLEVSGKLTANGKPIDLSQAVASMDWTRSVAQRRTEWRWSSVQGLTPQGVRLGLNLSALIYDDEAGNSQENALWLNGEILPLGGVEFILPDEPRKEPWLIQSRSPGFPEIHLEFLPIGWREELLNLGFIRSEFIQPYGFYSGRLHVCEDKSYYVPIDGMFGVAEIQNSLW